MFATRAVTNDTPPDIVVPILFVSGLLLLPLQSVQLGMAQPGHLWALAVLPLFLLLKPIRPTILELTVFLLFIVIALFNTLVKDYDHVKSTEQIFKFACVYPGIFLIGRWLGARYAERPLPFGWLFILALLLAECALQIMQVPYLFVRVPFMQDAIYGSFKERNWFAIFFFFLAYITYLKKGGRIWPAAQFFGFCMLVTVLSGSKTILVAAAIAVILQMKGGRYSPYAKVAAICIGGLFYFHQFSNELSGQLLQVRLQEERGLAFSESIRLIEENIGGYGFGFVESHFSDSLLVIRGLGAGVNSVFCSPLDLMIIAGIFGLFFWAIFFAGIGLGGFRLLAPVAAWSLLDPLHQSEIVYLFAGLLVSWGLARQEASQRHQPLRAAAGPRDRKLSGSGIGRL